jgi:CAAX protease family protein
MALSTHAPEPQPKPESPIIGAGPVDWSGRDVFIGILWFIGLFIIGQIVVVPAAIIYGASSVATYATAYIAGALVELAIVVVAANLTFRRYGGGWHRLGIKPITRKALLWAGAAFLGALTVSYLYALVVYSLGLDFLKTDCAEQVPKTVRDHRELLALASIVVVAFAPPCEELFFRGFLFTGLARRWGVPAAIVASGFLFSGAHLLPKSFVPIAGVGMVFAFTYWRSGNIFSTMLAHLSFNSLSIAFIAGGSCDTSSIGNIYLTMIHWSLPF